MSLFGGDSAPSTRASSPGQHSDFSITPIRSPSAGPEQQRNAELEDLHTRQLLEESPANLSSPLGPIEEDPEDDLVDYEDRPNKFRGPANIWKSFTREERLLAASLDKLRAGDLGIHLYNAHALKTRLVTKQTAALIPAWTRKSKWVSQNENGDRTWYPDRNWTAWPLDPDLVPRPDETFGAIEDDTDGYTYKSDRKRTPRIGLGEELLASGLRQVKKQWQDRRDKRDASGSARTTVGRRSRSMSRSRSTKRKDASSDRGDSCSSLSKDRSVTRARDPMTEDEQSADRGSQDEMAAMEDEIQLDQSQQNSSPTQTVMKADDDMSRRLLQPTINHTLSQLDKLLMALHHNRSGQYVRAGSESDFTDTGSRSSSRARSRSLRRDRSKTRRKRGMEQTDEGLERPSKKRQRSPTNEASSDFAPERSMSAPLSQTSNDQRSHDLNVRDWSEVLGLAAVSGWNTSALERAVNRCAALFGEGMSFRVLSELPSRQMENSMASADCRPNQKLDFGALSMADGRAFLDLDQDKRAYLCPEEACNRHTKSFAQGFRFREHLRRAHGYTPDEVEDLQRAMHMTGSDVPTSNPRGWIPPEILVCPHIDCKFTGKVFGEVRRFVEHLQRAHRYDPRRDSPPKDLPADASQSSRSSSNSSAESEDEVLGGVHVDGFLQPVRAFVGVRGRGKSKSLQLGNSSGQ